MGSLTPAGQPAWTELLSSEQRRGFEVNDGPLAGLRFAIKDNIDLEGVPTTAADPRNRTPAASSATAVARLIAAGAVPVGKTNLDQYATGLVGTRTPYGACHSVFSPEHVSGGSSSGSAVVVAEGLVDFALGTDTAGSGRVPAAFNELVGIKPSRGRISARGVVPACRSLDCVTVFARDVRTARRAYDAMAGFDAADAFSRRFAAVPAPVRPVIGVPDGPLGLDPLHEQAWQLACERAADLGTVVPVDVSAFLEAAALLYSGPWLAERWLAFGDALDDDPAVDPVVRAIVRPGKELSAAAAFAGFEQLAELARICEPVWARIDALLFPVTPTHPTLAQVAADPIGVNSALGRFTNMTNLLDLCAVAVPGPRRADGLPFGVQFLAPAGHDDTVANLAAAWCGEEAVADAGPDEWVQVAVAGAHLSGQPLNADLTRRGATLVRTTRMAPGYRMFVVDGPLPRPGLTRMPGSAGDDPGPEVEIWRMPAAAFGGFASTVAPPLAVGPVDLADGARVLGFVCTADAVDPARDITGFGGWLAYLAGTRSGVA
jgi:allophanate hydrolase